MRDVSCPPPSRWFILYRGPLSSCNYECGYCPFAKTRNTRAELAHDAACLARFVNWVESREEQIGILFTPWGEALHHQHYQEAFRTLSHMPNVWRVAAQTNLSCRLDWLQTCEKRTLALWTTFHPTQTTVPRFVSQCEELRHADLSFSVGAVGLKEAFDHIQMLREALHPEIYLWINAWKRERNYYNPEELAWIRRIDPHFDLNVAPHTSRRLACRSGQTAFTVDGSGDLRRCHFIPLVIGNIYQPGFEDALIPRPCTNSECRCHIGYVHLDHLNLDSIYGDGILERIPLHWPLP